MPHDDTNLTHDVERFDVSTLSETQRDMLWMRLRAGEVMFVFDGHDVTVSAQRATMLAEAVAWVRTEVRSPPRGYYPQPHPFQRTLGPGLVVAHLWRRIIAAMIDTFVMAILFTIVQLIGAPRWMLVVLNATYFIVTTRRWGRTVGKYAVEIRVVDASRHTRPAWRQCVVRWAAVGWIGIAGAWFHGDANRLVVLSQIAIYAPIVWDSQGCGLHDRLAGTIVMTTVR